MTYQKTPEAEQYRFICAQADQALEIGNEDLFIEYEVKACRYSEDNPHLIWKEYEGMTYEEVRAYQKEQQNEYEVELNEIPWQ